VVAAHGRGHLDLYRTREDGCVTGRQDALAAQAKCEAVYSQCLQPRQAFGER
jgi:hypothetical protein